MILFHFPYKNLFILCSGRKEAAAFPKIMETKMVLETERMIEEMNEKQRKN